MKMYMMRVVFRDKSREEGSGWDVVKTEVRRLMNMMFKYSDMKRRENSPPAYSTLKPETSSLSPSTKSNGARFVSARLVVNQIMEIWGSIRRTVYGDRKMCPMLKDFKIRTIVKRVRAILTS